MKAITEVTDGLSNTLVIVVAGEPVIWTRPDELEFHPKKPLPKHGGHFDDGFHAVLADGSVRFVQKGIDEHVLRTLITADAGDNPPAEKK